MSDNSSTSSSVVSRPARSLRNREPVAKKPKIELPCSTSEISEDPHNIQSTSNMLLEEYGQEYAFDSEESGEDLEILHIVEKQKILCQHLFNQTLLCQRTTSSSNADTTSSSQNSNSNTHSSTNVKLLLSKNREYNCHHSVLIACSDYFKKILQNKSFLEGKIQEINLENHQAEIIILIISYFYGQNIKIGPKNVKKLLEKADYFQIDTLKKICEVRMCKMVSSENCLDFYEFSKIHNLNKLLDIAWDLCMKEATLVVKSRQFLELSVDQLINFLSADDLNIEKEESIFAMIQTWLEYDIEHRKIEIRKIIESGALRLGLLSGPFLYGDFENYMTKYEDPSWVDSMTKPCIKYILSSDETKSSSVGSNLIDPKLLKPRMYCGTVPTLVVVGGINETSRIVKMHALQKIKRKSGEKYKWYPLPDITTKHSQAHSYLVSVLDNNIYITGGHHSSMITLNTVSMYNTHLNKWIQVASLNHDRERHAGISLEGELYVAGGLFTSSQNALNNNNNRKSNGSTHGNNDKNSSINQKEKPSVLSSVEKYSPKKLGDRWWKITDLPHKCYSPGMAAYGMKLYVVGGVGLQKETSISGGPGQIRKLVLSKVQIYDTTKNQWTVSNITEQLARLSCAVRENKIYLLANNQKLVQKYDMKTNELMQFSKLPRIRNYPDSEGLEFASCSIFDNKLVVCGGQISNNNNNGTNNNTATTPQNKMVDQINLLDLNSGAVLSGQQFPDEKNEHQSKNFSLIDLSEFEEIDDDAQLNFVPRDSKSPKNSKNVDQELKLNEGICMHGAVTIMYKRMEEKKNHGKDKNEEEEKHSIEVNEFEFYDRQDSDRNQKEGENEDKTVNYRLKKIFSR